MSTRRWKRFGILVSFLVLALAGYQAGHWLRWQERADPATGMAVELRPVRQVVKVGAIPELSVTLVNRGQRKVVLVEPGDGSDCGRRTPLIEWSRSHWFRGARCGSINGLRPEEVFVLKPGNSHRLQGWVGVPPLSGPGQYEVAVRYDNRPDQEWSGFPLREHDAVAMQQVRRSTRVCAISNAVEIVVEE